MSTQASTCTYSSFIGQLLACGARRSAEVGVLWDASEVDGLHTTPYRRDRLCVVTQATHPLARHNRLSFEKAIDHITVGVATGGMLDTGLRREAARLSTTMAQRVHVSGMDVAVRIAAAGLGTAVLPREAAHGNASASTLVFVPLSDDWAERRFVIVTRADNVASASARLLVEHLRDVARESGRS